MIDSLNILHVEDNLADAELIQMEIEKTFPKATICHVANKIEYEQQLKQNKFEIILSDFNVPGFKELEAYELAKKTANEEVPVIYISGALGEEKAIEILKKGVTDYIIKDNLEKIPLAIKRALKELQEQRDKSTAEKRLKESELFKTSILDALSSHIAVLDKDGVVISTNLAWDEFAKANDSNSFNTVGVGVNYIDVVKKSAKGDKDIEEIYEGILSVQSGSQKYYYKDYPCHSPTEERWYTLRVTPIKGQDGLVISHANITDRILAEKATQESKDQIELITNNVDIVIYKTTIVENKKNIVDYVSDKIYQLLGYTGENYKNHQIDFSQALKPTALSRIKKFNKIVLASKTSRPFSIEYQWYHPVKKEWVWLSETIVPKLENEKVTGLFGYVRDVSNRKSIEKKVEESQRRYKGLIENSSEITCITDKNGLIQFISPAITRLMGYSVKELIGNNVFDYIHSDDYKDAYDKFLIRYQEGGVGDYNTYKMRTKSGSYKYLRVMLSNHFDEPSINGFIINAQDVTELINAEKEKYLLVMKTEEAERQRISHDLHDGLGQKIAAANMYMNTLEELVREQLDEETFSIFQTGKKLINDATVETRLVSHNIMPRSLEKYGLRQTVDEMLGNYQKIYGHIKFELETNIEDQRFEEKVELTIFRVLQELMNNALKHSKANEILIALMITNEELRISVIDNGVGFDVKKARESKNAGIGLYSLFHRINMIGGKLNINSLKSKGTNVEITLKID